MTSPTPSSDQPLSAAMPAFLPPARPQTPRQDPPSSPDLSTSGLRPRRLPTPPDPLDDPAAPAAAGPAPEASFPASTDRPAPPLNGRAADVQVFRRMIAPALGVVGLLLAGALATTAEAQDAELWRMDDDDLRNIGDPLARIAARHAPSGPSGDVADAIGALTGAAGYVIKNQEKTARIDRDAAARGGTPGPLPEPAPVAEPLPAPTMVAPTLLPQGPA